MPDVGCTTWGFKNKKCFLPRGLPSSSTTRTRFSNSRRPCSPALLIVADAPQNTGSLP